MNFKIVSTDGRCNTADVAPPLPAIRSLRLTANPHIADKFSCVLEIYDDDHEIQIVQANVLAMTLEVET